MTVPAARQILDASLTERQFMDTVTDYARRCSWDYYHTWRSVHSVKGFPDLVLVRAERLVFAEIKRQSGKPTKEQVYWLERLAATGAETYIWRPSDWEQVREVLR